jgi:LCP family protein required for cell wall assembly
MSRYEDPEGTAGYPGAEQGRPGSVSRPGGRDGDDSWDGAGRTGKGRKRPSGRGKPSPAGPGRRGDTSGSPRSGAPRRTHRILGRHPVLSVLGIIATLALTFVSLTAYAAYRNVYDSIHHVTVTSRELGHRPPKLNGSTNILIIGSDSRAGSHGKYGRGIQGSRSDTSMLLHISPTHTGAIVASFPRDSMVPIYQCDADGNGHPGQQEQPGVLEQLNSTYSYGGAPCLWKTLEQTTNIHIDHFIEVNFESFKKIVDDVHGVPVCLPFAVDDPASGLKLSAGKHTVDGTQALAFVRERHIGLGSDLQRIQRQQIFLASLAQKIKASSSLSDPTQLYGLVHDIASSLTTDMNFTDLYAVANSLKGLSTSAVQFITVPVVPYPPNPNDLVEFDTTLADPLFRAIARDNHILGTARKDAREAHKQQLATVSTSKVHVQVLNGTGQEGLAGITASQLGTRGFRVAGTGNASASSSTVIEYGSAAQLPEANTLMQQISGAQVKEVSTVKGSAVDLVLGSGFKGLTSTHKPKTKKSAIAVSKSAAYNGVSASTNICHDQSAFAGPDTPADFSNG